MDDVPVPTTAAISSQRLPGRRAIITGAARGIGAGLARAFATAGACVAVVDRDDPRDVASGIGGVPITGDLAEPSGARRAIQEAIDALGGVDVLVNNAGVFRSTPLLDITADEWDEVFAVNARATLIATQVAASSMIDRAAGADARADAPGANVAAGGKIVNIASMGGKIGEANQAHYAASKAAVISLTQVAAQELGPHGINVNAVCPGYVLTDMGASGRTAEQVGTWCAKSPLGRLATVDDVAKMVLFLASPDADYCTGQAFNVTGGMIMH